MEAGDDPGARVLGGHVLGLKVHNGTHLVKHIHEIRLTEGSI